jgi:hypothetical protein
MPPSVGYFESELFEPDGWKPLHPNPAFDNMLDEDAFWACRIMGEFTRDDFRACVETARYSDPAATEYLIAQLWARRTKILEYYYDRVCPIDDVQIQDDGTSLTITFVNRRVIDSLVDPQAIAYELDVSRRRQTVVPSVRLVQSRFELAGAARAQLVAAVEPASTDEDRVFEVRITETAGRTRSVALAYVYFDGDPTHTRLVGLSRDN